MAQRDPVAEARLQVESVRQALFAIMGDVDVRSRVKTGSGERGGKRGKNPHPPAPADLTVLDYLSHAKSETYALAFEATGAAAADPDPRPIGGELVWPRRHVPGGRLGNALDEISEALPLLPPELGSSVQERLYQLSRGGSKILGVDGSNGIVFWRCPACHHRSATTRPHSDGQEAVCIHRGCRKVFPLGQVADQEALVS